MTENGKKKSWRTRRARSKSSLFAAGEPIVATLFQGGEFTSADTSLVWLILVFYAFGLPAIGLSRMLQNMQPGMQQHGGSGQRSLEALQEMIQQQRDLADLKKQLDTPE